jgi:hypothetical protein
MSEPDQSLNLDIAKLVQAMHQQTQAVDFHVFLTHHFHRTLTHPG